MCEPEKYSNILLKKAMHLKDFLSNEMIRWKPQDIKLGKPAIFV